MTCRVGLVGGRGYVGEALLRLLLEHPTLEAAWISSRSLQGRSVQSVFPDLPLDLTFESISPTEVAARQVDAVVLAMPNGFAADYVDAVNSGQKIIDISADYRSDKQWVYGLPEHNRRSIRQAGRVANPGCYATAVQLAIGPLLGVVQGVPTAFGVSGYSGAGRTPSERNDPDRLDGNILPYNLAGHLHELEISHRMQRDVRFMPHVAAFFRGISVTIAATLSNPVDVKALQDLYEDYYANEQLIDIMREVPEIRDVANTPRAKIGGFSVDQRDQRRVSLVACIDNLLKGAASQALQNLNLMLGIDEFSGLIDESKRTATMNLKG